MNYEGLGYYLTGQVNDPLGTKLSQIHWGQSDSQEIRTEFRRVGTSRYRQHRN